MCTGDPCGERTVSRRSFVVGASAALAGMTLGAEEPGRRPSPAETLADSHVFQGMVSFKCGADPVPGYLAHPKKEGRYRAVVVLHGNFGMPDLARYTAAMLAQNGFAALAVQRFARVPDLTAEDLARSDGTDRRYLGKAYNEQELIEALAALNYLTAQPFARSKGAGLLGYCGGGVQALWLSALTRQVKAVVVFHAPTGGPTDRFNNPQDPKPSLMAMVDQIKAPVQGHYGAIDAICPLPDVGKFAEALRERGTKMETFVYPGANHAFGDFTRPRLYQPQAAALAWARSVQFLRAHLR
jgi:carboxymethylenebutenolidase